MDDTRFYIEELRAIRLKMDGFYKNCMIGVIIIMVSVVLLRIGSGIEAILPFVLGNYVFFTNILLYLKTDREEFKPLIMAANRHYDRISREDKGHEGAQ